MLKLEGWNLIGSTFKIKLFRKLSSILNNCTKATVFQLLDSITILKFDNNYNNARRQIKILFHVFTKTKLDRINPLINAIKNS